MIYTSSCQLFIDKYKMIQSYHVDAFVALSSLSFGFARFKRSKMYNIGMKDAVPLLHTLLQSTHRLQPFQFRSQTPLQKGIPAEGTILQLVSDKLREGGQ